MQDLESGLYYSLWIEVANQPVLDAARQKVLHQHLTLHQKVRRMVAKFTTEIPSAGKYLSSEIKIVI